MSDLGRADWSDPERVKKLVSSYSQRYGPVFWKTMQKLTGGKTRATVADFGCGPGLFLADALSKYKAKRVIGLDASESMLKQASELLQGKLPQKDIILKAVDFDSSVLGLTPSIIDLAFSGFLLHEIRNPAGLVAQVYESVADGGIYAVYDFVSGNMQAFVDHMKKGGMNEVEARRRYPHMCRHSLSDLERMLVGAGFSGVESSVIDIRAVIVGLKSKGQILADDISPVSTMSEGKQKSPWAHDDSEVKCPRCGSANVSRVVDSWAMSRGIQVYSCASCGKKFYERGLDDYQPTFSEE